ncbi:unnamed protein product [Rotaria sp. Silwood2]|nr:unnamed protein product [Rotaria sp. Silwood2]CAF3987329.1 unnamed protein product [Rotaria sp. Silwood2]CAF4533984.1 unnamed protein product [Rotaria sp. Silwood2]
MIVKHDCLRGEPMINNGLCSLWSGIRATYGINQGRVAFQIKDFESEPGNVLLFFAKNNLNFELAYCINYEDFHSRPLFPHIFVKNVSFQVNFGQLNTKYSLQSGFRFINDYYEDDRIRGTLGPSSKEECEIIMMVGLPGAGKSFWVERHCAINIDKKYVVLSTNNIIYQMKIDNYEGSHDMMDRAMQCLRIMFDIAACRKRNIIIDQTNVYGNNRRRKMSLFDGFYRRAVVVIPDDNEYQRRRFKQQIEQDKFIPDSFVNQMKANFDLPEVADVFDDVEYAELTFRYARDLVMYYRHQNQIIKKETLRKKNKRKTIDNHWFHIKKNNNRSIQFSHDRHSNNIDLSFNHYHSPLLSHSKQHRHCLSTFNHHYYRYKNGSK